MSRIYLDACIIIYLVESASPFHNSVVNRLLQLQIYPASTLLTSRLSRLECRVRPLRDNDQRLLDIYDQFFSASGLHIVEILEPVVERATTLRASYGFPTPDALHLASAIEERADLFLTGDAALARCQELKVEVLSA